MLRVLDAPAEALVPGVCPEGPLEDVERLAIAAITDRVHAQLIAVGHREPGRLLDLLHGGGLGPDPSRLVRIRLEEPRAARAQRAVDRPLDRTNGEVPVAVVDHPVLLELGRLGAVAFSHHHPKPHAELPLVDHLLHHVDRRERRSGVLERRDALREHLPGRKVEDPARAFGTFLRGQRRLARMHLDETRRALAHQPRGGAGRVLEDVTACGVLRVPRHTGQLQRLAVREARVPARVGEVDRVVWRDRVERRACREPFDIRFRPRRPLLLVPAAPDDPLPGLRLLDRLGDHRDDLAPARRLHQLQVQLCLADAVEVAVALDEARDDELPLRVDHLRRGADVALDVVAGAERLDAIAADGDRLHLGHPVLHRHDLRVGDDEVGRLRGRLLRRHRRARSDGRQGGEHQRNESLAGHVRAPSLEIHHRGNRMRRPG